MREELAKESVKKKTQHLLDKREELVSKFIVDKHNLNGLGLAIQQLEKEIGELHNGR